MNIITLPDCCDRAATKALHPEISDALGPAPLLVQAGGVEKIGQAMLQLLLAAARIDGGIAISEPSPAFIDAITLTGLADQFTLQTSDPAEATP